MENPSRKEFELLALLSDGELSGRELAKAYEKEAGSKISYGTLYVTLNRMEEYGWVKSREDTDATGKFTIYKITTDGRHAKVSFRTQLEKLINFGLKPAI